jgi:phage-related protein
MARYLIDTDVMIDVSRRNAAARNQRDADGIDSLIKTYPVQADLDARITGRAYQLLKRHAKPNGLRTFDSL